MTTRTVAHGVICSLTDPTILEILAIAGYDFAVIEMEHQSLSCQEAVQMIRAGHLAGISVLFRTAGDPLHFLELADLGADGVVHAHVKNAADARAVVAALKYPPIGNRGISNITRAAKYGTLSIEQHMQAANRGTLAMLMIEDKEAVDNLSGILSVPGVDGIVIGPVDLSYACGVPGQRDHPRVKDAIDRIMTTARSHPDLAIGSGALNTEEIPAFVRNGGSMILLNDTSLVVTAFRDVLTNIKRSLTQA
jgi:4-hydroxy-2-oxoheptanedioate aldolase